MRPPVPGVGIMSAVRAQQGRSGWGALGSARLELGREDLCGPDCILGASSREQLKRELLGGDSRTSFLCLLFVPAASRGQSLPRG